MNIPFLSSEDKCDHEEMETVENGTPVADASLGADQLTVTVRQTYMNRCTNPDCDFAEIGVGADGDWPSFGEVVEKYHIPREDLEKFDIEQRTGEMCFGGK